ncbi:ABC transporter ATP-binding protein [Actinomyces vulturis]|uniref:ABC transporter ATP-binding protein n=1 Tax=Actinomyces vulturis TaxID=1857645 RepID=UPI0009F260FB|nr:ABC transporter ATP-binding protein [Actinomyces vulturis]
MTTNTHARTDVVSVLQPSGTGRIEATDLTLAYGKKTIVDDLSFLPPQGQLTVLAGPNGCGKSTLLRGLARLIPHQSGQVILNDTPIDGRNSKSIARELAVLPQSPIVPAGLTVGELVSRGRYPYRGVLRPWSSEDDAAVTEAIVDTDLTDLADRRIDSLSGGQRQRAWIAMVLAQRTGVLLLDEPTTYLDITYQIEVLDLLKRLVERRGTTIVVVLHELSLAARYAQHLVLMRDGHIYCQGPAHEALTHDSVRNVFDLEAQIITDPVSTTPLVIPIRPLRHHNTSSVEGGNHHGA